MGSNNGPIDLSDLDPFSPANSSRSASPHPHGALFPTSHPSSAASSSSARRVAGAASQRVDVQGEQVRGVDPLGGLLGGLSLSPSPSPTPAGAAAAAVGAAGSALPPPPGAGAQTQAGEQRQTQILADLTREPFSLPAGSSSVPIPSPSSSSPHTRPSHHPHAFSPPRRLSTLMSPSSTASPSSSAFAPGSPPASSAVFPDPFTSHLPRGGAERRMREASTGSSWDRTGETEAEAEAEAEASWGDFQEAPQTPPQLSLPPSPKLAPATRAPPKPARTYPDPATLSARAPARPVRAGTGAPAGAGHVGGGFDPAAQPIRLVGLRDGVARVLDEDVAEGIRPALPPRLRHSPRWTLLYSLDQHGISLSTLFTNLERGLSSRDGGFVLVLRTERAEVCGGYVSEALKRPSSEREGHGRERWVGDGSCFLFHTRPFPPSDPRLGLAVKTFKPTFRNSYFAHASPSASSSSSSSRSYTSGSFSPPPGAAVDAGFIALGGGNDGVFGLWLDGVLERGWTGRSETYANEPLVVGDGQGAGGRGFEVVGLECWAVGS